MDCMKMGALLRRLRKEQNMTQHDLAQRLCVSEQAVSKWERGLGAPDVALLAQLCRLFGVSAATLLSGDLSAAGPESGDMKRLKFYVCPACGGIYTAMGEGELHCCGRKLGALQASGADEEHAVHVQAVEEDWYITFSHPMEKDHYIRFAAYVRWERMAMVRLYPEQGGEVRLPQMRGGRLYLCCSRHGLFEVKL